MVNVMNVQLHISNFNYFDIFAMNNSKLYLNARFYSGKIIY